MTRVAGRRRIAGIVPCAGRSRRMGADKPSLDAGGERFLERTVATLARRCDPVVVVIAEGRPDLAERARSAGAEVRINADPGRGPISSIGVALREAPDDWAGVMLLPVDHPAVAPDTVDAVADAFDADSGAAIVVPVVDGRTGHPPIFGRAVFAELLDPELEGGARAVLHRDEDRVRRVEVDDPGIRDDLDTAEGWETAIEEGRLAPPAPLTLAEAAALLVEAVEDGREAVHWTRLDPLPPTRMVVTASRDRSRLESFGSLGGPVFDAQVRERAHALLAGRDPDGEIEVDGVRLYVEAHRPRPDLVIVGAGHISIPLARVGAVLGFTVRVLDDRPEFATAERFDPDVDVRRVDFARAFDEVPVGPLTHVVLVTRGHRYDYECLLQLLRLPVPPRYVGLIGSRRRVRATFVQLREEGIDRDRIAMVRAPVGLDLGAETPGEIAVAVGAEIVREWRGGTGDPLREKERILERFFREEEA